MWFWFAFVGVFGFEVLLQNINLTFADKGVLTISDWINEARDPAVAAAVRAQATWESNRGQALAARLKTLPEAELNAHLLSVVSAAALKKRQDDAQASRAGWAGQR